MTAGINAQGPSNKLWALYDLDRGELIEGQFIAQSVTRNVSMDIAHGSSINTEDPFSQFIRGTLKTITFTGRFFAKHSEDTTVDARLDRLEDLVRRSNDLQRPPICDFFLGDVDTLTMTCLVRSLGGITYDETFDSGMNRGVTFQVTLEKYIQVTLGVTDPTKPETFTRRRRAKQGDTYESIAQSEYGDPELGILLRQINPRVPGMELADLNVKDEVHIYPEDYLLEMEVEPQFHGFRSGVGHEAAETARRELLETRAADQWTTEFADSSVSER